MSVLTDTQNESDHRNVPIDRVGVKDLRFPISIKDRNDAVQHTVSTVSLAVDLPHHFKGTHMSRFVEVLNAHGPELDVHRICQIPIELRARLDAKQSHITFTFPYFISKKAPVSEKTGLIDYEAVFELDSTESHTDFILTVRVPVATLCPCSKAISERGAHNQRGLVTYSVRFETPIWIEDLIERVESCASCDLYSLLKRPDEKYVTERAYDNPVFVEDLVRNVAVASNEDPNVLWYRVEAENFESIHNHNAYAMIESDRGGDGSRPSS